MNLLISLSETDKRVIIAILLAIIILFVIIGFIGSLICRVMKRQGRKLDDLTHDVVITRVVDNKKSFIKYARKKSWRLFFVQSWKPLIIMLAAGLLLLTYCSITKDFSYNVFDYKETGIGTWFFIWDFEHIDNYCTSVFGMRILSRWPDLISSPHWSWKAWVSYLFVPAMFVGGLWYLWTVQSVISRTIQMYKRADSIYSKSLENYNQTDAMSQAFNNSNNSNNSTN